MGTQLPLPKPNGCMDQDGTWHGDPLWFRPHCARWRPSSPPQFSAHVYCGQTAASIKMTLGVEVGLGPGHFVIDGDPAPLPKKGDRAPQFSVHLYCGQRAGCIKVPLGMEIGLSPGAFLLDVELETQLPPKRAQGPSIFGP